MSTAVATVAGPMRALGGVSLDALVILFTRRFSWREVVQQAWFIAGIPRIDRAYGQ